jgi:hypothetical protein
VYFLYHYLDFLKVQALHPGNKFCGMKTAFDWPLFWGNVLANISQVYAVGLKRSMLSEGALSPLSSISSTFFARFFYTNVVSAAFFTYIRTYISKKKSCRNNIRTKKARKNIDEIDTWSEKNFFLMTICTGKSLPIFV